MTQRRRHPRKDSGLTLVLAGREHDIVDLSLGGLCLRTDKPLPEDRPLSFALSLPGGARVEGQAQVRWAEKDGWRRAHGLEITQMRPWARRSLRKHLNPYHFGFMEVLDLSLEFSCAVVTVLAVKHVLQIDPALAQLALEGLPWAFMAGALGTGAFLLSRA